MKFDFDVAIIGAGPGGYVAAIRASQLGLKTTIIEMDKPGGVCLNVGCIPSKTLIQQAEHYRSIPALENAGIKVDTSGLDYRKIFQKSRQAAERLSKGVQHLLKKNKVEYIHGRAEFISKNELSVNDKSIHARNIIIATGSSPREIPNFQFDEEKILSSTGALMLEELPESMVILGAGAIGMEFAHILSTFGTKITVVEMQEQILPLEDNETANVVRKEFEKRGITLLPKTKALSVVKNNDGIDLEIENAKGATKFIQAAKLLVAIGRTPNTDELRLERIGIETEHGFIPVNEYYKTVVPNVYAIGDVVASPLLAHVASKEGEIAVEHIAGKSPDSRIDPGLIPSAVYCEPQIGSFGLTLEKARLQGLNAKAASFPFVGIGKAVATGHSEGMVKVIYHSDSGEIFGVHAVGSGATEIIHELLLAKKSELILTDVAEMIHAHPTISEGIMEAARAAEGWAIHI